MDQISIMLQFKKSGNNTWVNNPKRGYSATIVYDVGVTDKYILTIHPDETVTSHDTLRLAKQEFKRFMRSKPV